MSTLKILVLEDEQRFSSELVEYLETSGYTAIAAGRPSEAFLILDEREIDIAIVDIKLPEYDGLQFLGKLKERFPAIEAIIMSGHGDMDSVIEAMRRGAFDYLRKPFASYDLQAALARTGKYLESRRESRRYADLCASLNAELAGEDELIGNSAAMEKVREGIALAARNSESPVLIHGESGTGKELVARRIHALSSRASGRFVPVNCAAIPREMFESEFFGHTRGSFTDAHSARPGLFREADGGTLFLDEIGEIPVDLQAKLLRAIEDRRVRALGSDKEQEIDVRIICATNRNLLNEVEANTFRGDLYYRIAVIEIEILPLRDRPSDIVLLAHHFSRRFAHRSGTTAFTEGFMRRLSEYSFPGNVRELRNIIERASITGNSLISEDFLGFLSQRPRSPDTTELVQTSESFPELLTLEALERTAIQAALKRTNGNVTRAADLLGITRQSLHRRIEGFSIKPTH